jgi:hypothetical protein
VSNVNRNPAGILELLNLNLQGEFPRLLGGEVVPNIAMEKYFLQGIGITSARALALNIIAAGQQVSLTVPATETWSVRGVSLNALQNDPTNSFSGSINVQFPDSREMVLVSGTAQTVFLNQFYRIGATFPETILFGPGVTFLATCNTIAGVPVAGLSFVFDVIYHRLTLG